MSFDWSAERSEASQRFWGQLSWRMLDHLRAHGRSRVSHLFEVFDGEPLDMACILGILEEDGKVRLSGPPLIHFPPEPETLDDVEEPTLNDVRDSWAEPSKFWSPWITPANG